MQVFQAVKDQIGDADKPQHFCIEQAPEDEEKLVERNAHLAKLGITAIWFEKGRFDYVENILRLSKNELRYRGVMPGAKKAPTLNEKTIGPNNEGFIAGFRPILYID